MLYINTPPKADVLEDVMDRIKALSEVLDLDDGVRISHIREGLQKFNRVQLCALWGLLSKEDHP